MSSARTSTLASLRGSIERLEANGDAHAFNRAALGHASADAMLRGGLAVAAVHEVFAEGHQGAAATGFIAGLAGRIAPRKPLVWVRQDFAEIESGALSMSGLAELGLDPRLVVTVRAADAETALARHRRRARLRCGRHCRAGSLGRDAPARSRRQPKTHARRPSLRRHRAVAAGGGGACAFDRGNAMDRARGAFAAWLRLGVRGARRCSTRTSFVTVMARSGGGSWNGNVMSAFSENRRRILSLWLPRLPIDRIKRQLA